MIQLPLATTVAKLIFTIWCLFVQAKKFVEELPQTVKQNISKEEAAKLKERLEAAGGVVEIH